MKTFLPIAGIPLYDINNLNAQYYTTVYLGTYLVNDHRENVGSHCGIDIDATKYPNGQTDVFAIADGKVEIAKQNHPSNGNYIVLKHENVPSFSDPAVSTNYYSCYLHLSSLGVVQGQNVSGGHKIGVTGDTGNTTAAHLHLQMDTSDAPFHPYWPFTSAEAAAAGYTFTDAVNAGVNLDKAQKYNIHPMLYIQKYLESSGPLFPDIPESDSDYAAIKYLKDQGVLQGYPDGLFKPDNPINRAELLKVAFLGFQYPVKNYSASSFPDVKTTDWFFPYVETAKQDGLVSGHPDGTFKPASFITRAETLKILLNVGAIPVTSPATSSYYSDVAPNAWYAPYVNKAYEQHYIDPASAFQPNTNVTRRSVARWLYRMVGP